MANLVEQGDTPLLPPTELHDMGYKIVLYPLTAMNAAMKGMGDALAALGEGRTSDGLLDFAEIRDVVGFTDYYQAEKKYAAGD
jgi:2-methylisocitrate lyase-like PEP mutase family enzyme